MSLIDTIRNFFRPMRQDRRDAPVKRSLEPLRSIADLDGLLGATGSALATALVHRVARSCFHILPHSVTTEAPLGCSRLGGTPDCALGDSWPRAKDGSLLRFYGQINVEDIPNTGGPSLLPARGLLSIFGGAIESASESIEVRVVVTSPGTTLRPLTPPNDSSAFGEGRPGSLAPVRIRFEPGLSFPTESANFLAELEVSAPACDIDALLDGLRAVPDSAIGQLLGYAQFPLEEVHSQTYFAEIGRVNQDRLLIWESWEDWQAAKNMHSRMANGHIYRPWSAADDDNVQWILANKEAIASGIEKWHSVLWINSNPLMNLWINDADPIYFLAKIDHDGLLDLSNVRAGVTQS